MPARHPYRRGDVVRVRFPFSGPSGQKERPAVVLSTDDYHDGWDELLVVSITSKSPRKTRHSDCFSRDWIASGLQVPSWTRSHLATVHRLLVIDKIGSLTTADLAAVEEALRNAAGL